MIFHQNKHNGTKSIPAIKRRSCILLFVWLLSGFFLLSGCAAAGAMVLSLNQSCRVKINALYIKGSCELTNGVLFEQLSVLTKDSTGLPSEYTVTARFACYNPGTENATMYRPDKIYFRQPNGTFKWSADTVNISYKSAGRNRQIVSIQQKPERYDEMFILNNRQYDICPHNFQKDTWYYVKIHDQRVAKTFLYIDRNKRFHVYKVNIAICPV